MVSAFWMWMIVAFMTFFGLIFTCLMCALVWARTSGKWGGGVGVWDLTTLPAGGHVSEKRIVKTGSMYSHYAGGGEGFARRLVGLFKTEDWPIKEGHLVKLDETHFLYGLQGIEHAAGVHIAEYGTALASIENELAEFKKELGEQKHDIQSAMERVAGIAEKMSKAVVLQIHRSGGKRS